MRVNWYIVIILLLVVAGCAGNKVEPIVPKEDAAIVDLETAKARIEYVYKTNKVAVLFILGIAAGVFLLIQGNKIGLGLIIACSGGLYALASYQAFATHPYLPSVVAVCGLLAGVGWFAYREWIRRQATAKEIEYGEHMKDFTRGFSSVRRKEWQKDHKPQSKAVQKQIDKDLIKNRK